MSGAGKPPKAPSKGLTPAQVVIFWDREGRDRLHLAKEAQEAAVAFMWCGLDGSDSDATPTPLVCAPGEPEGGRLRVHVKEVCHACVATIWDENVRNRLWRTLIRVVSHDEYGAWVVLPSWNSEQGIYLPWTRVTAYARWLFTQPRRLHAMVNVGIEEPDLFRFEDWEPD